MDTLPDVEITATGEIVTQPVVPSDAASPNITGDEQEEEAVAGSAQSAVRDRRPSSPTVIFENSGSAWKMWLEK